MLNDQLPPESNESETSPEETLPVKPARRRKVWTGLIAVLFVLMAVLAVWMYLPALRNLLPGTPSPTLPPPTETPTSAPTDTATLPPQPTPLPSATGLPASGYLRDVNTLDPKLPGQSGSVIMLNEDSSATADPPFDALGWYSSETIAEQIGRVINEPFFATTGPASVRWTMDKALQPGLYEIYVLDTVYSSAGGLDFKVLLSERELAPVLGNPHIDYRSQSGDPAQLSDEWAYLGMYELDTPDLLSVSTAWEARDMSTVVAIDRILIAPQPDSLRTYLSQLPANMPKYVIDDTAALVDSSANWFTRTDLPAWGGSFQTVINPMYDSLVTWSIPGQAPVGTYDIWVRMPVIDAEADLTFRLIINDEASASTLVASTENIPAGQWVSLGAWDVVSGEGIYARDFATLALQMEIPRDFAGEIGIDAAAFIRR